MHALLVKLGLVKAGVEARKTISFGDPEAAKGGLFWSILSVSTIIGLWLIYGAVLDGMEESRRNTLALYMPPISAVIGEFTKVATDGFRNYTLLEHIGVSLYRMVVGFVFGCLIGIPLGFAMGLSKVARGILDPIVEVMRPVPPLALIPLAIIWMGIGDFPKIFLLFLAALWVMILAARAGVQSIRLSKIHAAYTLGASKKQVLVKVILPNALPEIFTGMRVSMGVCWGTLVAAELVAATAGTGFMIVFAGKILNTALVLVGIIIIGIIAAAIDVGMRKLEAKMVPWKGKA